jgi:mycofactocin precursor peptide peptidase
MSSALADLAWPDATAAPPVRSWWCRWVLPSNTAHISSRCPLTPRSRWALPGLSRPRRCVVVAPAVAYGSSGEHSGFAGTWFIGQEATELVLLELGRSASVTFRRTLLTSTHGCDLHRVSRGVRRLRDEGGDVRGFFPVWSGDAHAGCAETSLMLALAPSRVQLTRAEAGVTAPLSDLLPGLVADGVREISPNGVSSGTLPGHPRRRDRDCWRA